MKHTQKVLRSKNPDPSSGSRRCVLDIVQPEMCLTFIFWVLASSIAYGNILLWYFYAFLSVHALSSVIFDLMFVMFLDAHIFIMLYTAHSYVSLLLLPLTTCSFKQSTRDRIMQLHPPLPSLSYAVWHSWVFCNTTCFRTFTKSLQAEKSVATGCWRVRHRETWQNALKRFLRNFALKINQFLIIHT